MAGVSDYNVCICPREDAFVPTLEGVSRLVDYLDSNMYLDGPDRDNSRLVLLPRRETQNWSNYLRYLPEDTTPPLRKRYVHLLHSPTAEETYYKHYGQLCQLIENIMPRDSAFVASLGMGTRRLFELSYLPTHEGQERPWIQYVVAHILNGYHGLWTRVWDEQSQQKEWELKAAKGFTFMIACKINPKVEAPALEKYLEELRSKPQFEAFLELLGYFIGTTEFELIGEQT